MWQEICCTGQNVDVVKTVLQHIFALQTTAPLCQQFVGDLIRFCSDHGGFLHQAQQSLAPSASTRSPFNQATKSAEKKEDAFHSLPKLYQNFLALALTHVSLGQQVRDGVVWELQHINEAGSYDDLDPLFQALDGSARAVNMLSFPAFVGTLCDLKIAPTINAAVPARVPAAVPATVVPAVVQHSMLGSSSKEEPNAVTVKPMTLQQQQHFALHNQILTPEGSNMWTKETTQQQQQQQPGVGRLVSETLATDSLENSADGCIAQ
jgi:hypothetical protein